MINDFPFLTHVCAPIENENWIFCSSIYLSSYVCVMAVDYFTISTSSPRAIFFSLLTNFSWEFFWALKIEFIEKISIKLKPTRISIFILSHNYENFNINKKIVTGIHQPTSSSLSLHLLLRTHEMEMQSLQIYGNYIAIEIKSIPSNFTSSGGLSILLQLYAHTKPIFLAIVRHWMVH